MRQTQSNEIEMLTRHEVAALLKVNERTVDNRVITKELPAYKIGASIRFKKSEVIQYIDRSVTNRI